MAPVPSVCFHRSERPPRAGKNRRHWWSCARSRFHMVMVRPPGVLRACVVASQPAIQAGLGIAPVPDKAGIQQCGTSSAPVPATVGGEVLGGLHVLLNHFQRGRLGGRRRGGVVISSTAGSASAALAMSVAPRGGVCGVMVCLPFWSLESGRMDAVPPSSALCGSLFSHRRRRPYCKCST